MERDLFSFWVDLPEAVPRALPETQRLTREILGWTAWSQRKLARVLDTTHPTVRALEEGRSAARARDLFSRLVETHGVVERIFLVAHRDAEETDRLLSTAGSDDNPAAVTLLQKRHPTEAFLAALEVQRPRRQAGMMRSIWPAEAGQGTVALDETDPA